jgi:hypothetical protein
MQICETNLWTTNLCFLRNVRTVLNVICGQVDDWRAAFKSSETKSKTRMLHTFFWKAEKYQRTQNSYPDPELKIVELGFNFRKLHDPDLRGWFARKFGSWDQHIRAISGTPDPGCRFEMVQSGLRIRFRIKMSCPSFKKGKLLHFQKVFF